jgi:hypothetical protein
MTNPVPSIVTVSDIACAATFIKPSDSALPPVFSLVRRRRIRRNSLNVKKIATAMNAKIPDVSERRSGMPLQ